MTLLTWVIGSRCLLDVFSDEWDPIEIRLSASGGRDEFLEALLDHLCAVGLPLLETALQIADGGLKLSDFTAAVFLLEFENDV